MKLASGKTVLIGPGNKNYGKGGQLSIQRELTPELSDKIWKAMQKRFYDEKVSKDLVLHHLKQLKAQMGKALKASQKIRNMLERVATAAGIQDCMDMIDNKIAKIK